MKVNKKVFVIAVIILAVIVISVITAVFIVPAIKMNLLCNKIKKIDAREFETKLIKQLETSALNINNSEYRTEFRVLDSNKSKMDEYEEAAYDMADSYSEMIGKEKMDKPYKYFISAFIIDKKDDSKGIIIPCFAVLCDSDGKLKGIEYINTSGDYSFISRIVGYEIQEVLKEEYNINIDLMSLYYNVSIGNHKISAKMNNKKMTLEYWINEEDTIIDIFKTISNNMGDKYGAYSFKRTELTKERDLINGTMYIEELPVNTITMIFE